MLRRPPRSARRRVDPGDAGSSAATRAHRVPTARWPHGPERDSRWGAVQVTASGALQLSNQADMIVLMDPNGGSIDQVTTRPTGSDQAEPCISALRHQQDRWSFGTPLPKAPFGVCGRTMTIDRLLTKDTFGSIL
jgi:hypothetical protein